MAAHDQRLSENAIVRDSFAVKSDTLEKNHLREM